MILPVVAVEAVRIQHLPEALPEAVAENSRRDVWIQTEYWGNLIVKKEKLVSNCETSFSLLPQIIFSIFKITLHCKVYAVFSGHGVFYTNTYMIFFSNEF